MAFLSVDIDDRKMAKLLRTLPKEMRSAMGRGLRIEAELIIGDAKELTPVDTGTLRSSGFVDRVRKSADEVFVEAGFGGPAADYALAVHEKTNVHHEPGQAKYLEEPFNAAVPGMDERIAAVMRKALKGVL